MTLKWKYFLSKRRLTPSAFIEARKLNSYDALVGHLTSLSVEAPAFDEVAHLFRKNVDVAPGSSVIQNPVTAMATPAPEPLQPQEVAQSPPKSVAPERSEPDNTPPPAQEKKVAQDLFKKRKKAQPKQQSKQQKESTIEEEADVDTHDV